MRPSAVTVLSLLSTIQFTNAQTANGVIVPFSTLPTCATLCGPLYDVQGACSPPHITTINDSCFCSDPRLTAITESGTAWVSGVCPSTPGSCTATADLQAIQSWYTSFCAANKGVTSAATTTATNSAATSSSTSSTLNGSSSSNNNSNSGKTTW